MQYHSVLRAIANELAESNRLNRIFINTKILENVGEHVVDEA